MIKPPVVYAIGLMRALGLQIKDGTLYDALNAMGQLPYFPPTVAGWEGGPAWLNTNTALSRFGLANKLLSLKYATLPTKAPEDEASETPEAGLRSAPTRRSARRGWPGARSARSSTTRRTPRPPPRATASHASASCARSCSPAPTHR